MDVPARSLDFLHLFNGHLYTSQLQLQFLSLQVGCTRIMGPNACVGKGHDGVTNFSFCSHAHTRTLLA